MCAAPSAAPSATPSDSRDDALDDASRVARTPGHRAIRDDEMSSRLEGVERQMSELSQRVANLEAHSVP